jgi:hypothetical protein
MALDVAGQKIESIAIVDDDENARETYGEAVALLDVIPNLESGPITDLDEFLERLVAHSQAVVCDYHLRKTKRYARNDGDQIVETCYARHFPAILCTSFSNVDFTLSRRRRQFIPALMNFREINPDSIVHGIERCIKEYAGMFSATRQPTRTLVRIDEILADAVYIVVPGWDPVERIFLSFEDIPPDILRAVKNGVVRLHTEANVGAERLEDLYFDFDKWEAR